jgi:PAS domain S-box-containing protein
VIKVLIIGDDHRDCQEVRLCGERAGMAVSVLDGAAETGCGLAEAGDAADCVVLDSSLSAGEGLALLGKLIQAGSAGKPVVVLTEREAGGREPEFLKAGASACLSKSDLSPERLASVIHSSLRRSAPAPTFAASRTEGDTTRALLDSLPSPVAMLDSSGRIVAVNEAWIAFARETGDAGLRDDQLGQDYLGACERVFPASRGKEAQAGLRSVLEHSAERFTLRYEVRSEPGTRWFEMSAVPLKGATGGAVVSHTEITERERAGQVMRESARRLHLALGAADVATWSWAVKDDWVSADDRMHAMFGVDPPALEGSLSAVLSAHIHPEDLSAVESAVALALASGRDTEAHFRVVRPDGAVRHLTAAAYVIRDDRGSPEVISGVCLDSTGRREIEELLANERKLLRTVIDNLPDYIYAKDKESRFLLCNEALLRLLGVKKESDAVNKSDADFFPEEYAERYYRDEQFIIRTGQSVIARCEPVLDQKSGRGWLNTTKVPLRNEQGDIVGIVGMGRDITEFVETKDELEQLVRQLARSNSDLERFAFVASHDLQEPLRKVQSFAERLRTKYEENLDENGREYLRRMDASLNHMRNLLNGLLDVSRFMQEDENFGLVDLAGITKQVLYDLADRVERQRARIEVGALPSIEANAVMMRALLHHLLDNALKFTRPGVSAEVVVASRVLSDSRSGSGAYPEEWIEITVEDNGIGFDERYVSQVFEIFKRLHKREEFEGVGVGLALCRRIVEQHHGTIAATSQPGVGSKFVVRLPVQQPKRRANPPIEAGPELEAKERFEVIG